MEAVRQQADEADEPSRLDAQLLAHVRGRVARGA
jgi:hypothetical protein